MNESDAQIKALVDRAEKAERACQTLGKVVEDQCRDIARITKSEHLVREDGDADWGAIWERGFAMADDLAAARSEADRLRDTLASTRRTLARRLDDLRGAESVLHYTQETLRLTAEAERAGRAEVARLRVGKHLRSAIAREAVGRAIYEVAAKRTAMRIGASVIPSWDDATVQEDYFAIADAVIAALTSEAEAS